MIRPLSLAQLADRCGSTAPAQAVSFTSVTTDSRSLKPGDLFVALRGERFDGHDFLGQVAERGACGAVVESADNRVHLPQLVVNNTVKALGQLGAMNREQFNGSVVGITGSAGKTTVKEMIAAILAQQGRVLVTKGNLNNHIGVPLMLLQINPEHHYAVIEMGASAVGEIAYLAELAKPGVSVVTNVGTAHVGGFGSVDRIALGKSEIYRALPANGTAIINRDDHYSEQWLQQNAGRRVLSFGIRQAADVRARVIVCDKAGRPGFTLVYGHGAQEESVPVQLALLGEHNVMNALAAAACCVALGVSLPAIRTGLESVRAVAGRMQVKHGINDAIIIDDTYNANPASVKAAIDALRQLPGKHVLVLGDMAELGRDAEALHRDIGRYARQQHLEMLLATGPLSRFSAEGFGAGARHFPDREQLVVACRDLLQNDTVMLVKGSRSAAMETVVQSLVLVDQNVEEKEEKRAC